MNVGRNETRRTKEFSTILHKALILNGDYPTHIAFIAISWSLAFVVILCTVLLWRDKSTYDEWYTEETHPTTILSILQRDDIGGRVIFDVSGKTKTVRLGDADYFNAAEQFAIGRTDWDLEISKSDLEEGAPGIGRHVCCIVLVVFSSAALYMIRAFSDREYYRNDALPRVRCVVWWIMNTPCIIGILGLLGLLMYLMI